MNVFVIEVLCDQVEVRSMSYVLQKEKRKENL